MYPHTRGGSTDKHPATREPHGDDAVANDHGQASSLYDDFSSGSHAHADQCMACAVLRCVCHPLTVLGLMATTLLLSVAWRGGGGHDRDFAIPELNMPNQGVWRGECRMTYHHMPPPLPNRPAALL